VGIWWQLLPNCGKKCIGAEVSVAGTHADQPFRRVAAPAPTQDDLLESGNERVERVQSNPPFGRCGQYLYIEKTKCPGVRFQSALIKTG
jgi:hypothetical protein